MIKARTRRFVALGGVLAVSVAVLAGGPYESKPPTYGVLAMCSEPHATCVFSIDPPQSPSRRRAVTGPPPTRLTTNGVPGCVRGSRRPVLNTTTPTLAATYAANVQVSFELAPVDGSAEPDISDTQATAGEPVVWQIDENGLAPGRTYRWRTTSTPLYLDETPVWSEWCEFTVAAGLVDLRPATDVATVRELRVDPVRRYPVTLTVRQWRLVLDPFDDSLDENGVDESEPARRISADIRALIAGRAAARSATLTLTGNDWAYVASDLASYAIAWDLTYEEDPQAGNQGPKYWRVIDRISAALGGPAHPSLGAER